MNIPTDAVSAAAEAFKMKEKAEAERENSLQEEVQQSRQRIDRVQQILLAAVLALAR